MATDNTKFVSLARLKYFSQNLPWKRMRKAMGLGDTLGALGVENGGTGVNNLGDLGLLIDQAKTASTANKIVLESKGTSTYTSWQNGTNLNVGLPLTIKQDPYNLFNITSDSAGSVPNLDSAVPKKGIVGTMSVTITANVTQQWAQTSNVSNSYISIEANNVGTNLGTTTEQNISLPFYTVAGTQGNDVSWNVTGKTTTKTPTTSTVYIFKPGTPIRTTLRYSLNATNLGLTSGSSTFTVTISILPFIY